MKRAYGYVEAGDYLNLSEYKIRTLVRENKLPVKYAGKDVLIDVADLDAYFDSLPSERV